MIATSSIYANKEGQISCAICPRNAYTLLTDEKVVVRTVADYKVTKEIPQKLPTACLGCPKGTEYYEYKQNEDCASSALVPVIFAQDLQLPMDTSCCRPCLINSWRDGTVISDSCNRLNAVNSATFAPYGQARSMICIKGEEKKYCLSRDWSQWP